LMGQGEGFRPERRRAQRRCGAADFQSLIEDPSIQSAPVEVWRSLSMHRSGRDLMFNFEGRRKAATRFADEATDANINSSARSSLPFRLERWRGSSASRFGWRPGPSDSSSARAPKRQPAESSLTELAAGAQRPASAFGRPEDRAFRATSRHNSESASFARRARTREGGEPGRKAAILGNIARPGRLRSPPRFVRPLLSVRNSSRKNVLGFIPAFLGSKGQTGGPRAVVSCGQCFHKFWSRQRNGSDFVGRKWHGTKFSWADHRATGAPNADPTRY